MYALSLGFIIFINVSYQLTIDSFTFQIQQSSGVPLYVFSPEGRDSVGHLNQIHIKSELEVSIYI